MQFVFKRRIGFDATEFRLACDVRKVDFVRFIGGEGRRLGGLIK